MVQAFFFRPQLEAWNAPSPFRRKGRERDEKRQEDGRRRKRKKKKLVYSRRAGQLYATTFGSRSNKINNQHHQVQVPTIDCCVCVGSGHSYRHCLTAVTDEAYACRRPMLTGLRRERDLKLEQNLGR